MEVATVSAVVVAPVLVRLLQELLAVLGPSGRALVKGALKFDNKLFVDRERPWICGTAVYCC